MNRSQRYRLKDVDAYRKRKREYAKTPAQREKRRAYNLQWYYRNRDKALRNARKYYQKHKHKHKNRNKNAALLARFGITLARYKEMLEAQGGVCAICKKAPTTRNLHVDHCHSTGRVRGLLCGSCNGRLGWLELYRDAIGAYPI